MRMPDFIVEISEAGKDLKEEREEQERQIRQAQAKAHNRSRRRR